MKTFTHIFTANYYHEKPAEPSIAIVIKCYLAITALMACLPFQSFAQAPAISYASPQAYIIHTPISPVSSSNTGGAVQTPAYNSSVTTFASGLGSPTGLITDAAGNVYVADAVSNSVVKYTSSGGGPVTVATGFNNPAGLAIDAAGNIYVADAGNNAIKEIPAAGGSVITILSGASQLVNPHRVAITPDGFVYFTESGSDKLAVIVTISGTTFSEYASYGLIDPVGLSIDINSNIFVADTTKNSILQMGNYSMLPTAIKSGLNKPQDVVVDATGNFFITDKTSVYEIPAGTNSFLTLATGLQPNGLAIGPKGDLYVSDKATNSVKTIAPAGGYYLSTALPPGLGMDQATGIISGTPTALSPATDYNITAYNSSGSSTATINIAVNNSALAPAISYTSPQTYTIDTAIPPLTPANAGSDVTPPGYNTTPTSLTSNIYAAAGTTDASGNIYLALFQQGEIVKLPPGGGTPVTVLQNSDIPFALANSRNSFEPSGVAVDDAGDIFALDYYGGDVIELPAGGGPPVQFGDSFSGLTESMCVDRSGNLFVNAGTQIIKFGPAGGAGVVFATGFTRPQGLAADANGNVFVTDEGANAVYKLSADGSSKVTLASGLFEPTGAAVDGSGNFFFVDGHPNLVKEIPAGGGAISGLTDMNNILTFVAVDPAGRLIVGNQNTDKIDEFTPFGGYYTGNFLPAGLTIDANTGVISGTPTDPVKAADYKVTAYNSAGSSTTTVNINVLSTHIISSTGAPTALITGAGTASGSTSFNVSGSNMLSGILVTPPAGFEVSTDNINFGSTVSIGGAGTIASTAVYVRLPAADTVGNYSGNIVLSSTKAFSVDVAIPASTVNAVAPVITSFSPSFGPAGTLVTINGTNLNSPAAITIGGQPAVIVSDNGSTTTSVLVAMVMPGAATGAVSITNGGGAGSSAGTFVVVPSSFPSAQQGTKLVGSATSHANEGNSVALSADGNTAVVGVPLYGGGTGAILIYTRSGGVWSQQGPALQGRLGIGDRQGHGVAISADGNTVFADDIYQTGLWVYTRTAGVWSQQGPKLEVQSDQSDQQGGWVAASADGNTAIIGGYSTNLPAGGAWVYIRSKGVWTRQGSMLSGSGASASAHQGGAVAMSADGNTAIVGAANDNSGAGAAWVYTRTAGVWTQQGSKLTGSDAAGGASLGISVAISADGNTAVVGGNTDNSGKGACWVYTRSGGVWTQQGTKLVGTGASDPAGQGVSVSISADGNTITEGGEGDNTFAGASWVFTRSGSTWTQQGTKLIGTGASGSAAQGTSVALSADGNTALVGANSDNSGQGAVWAFVSGTHPQIAIPPSIPALSTVPGTASAPATFNISGTNMLAAVLVTPPAGFEVSTDNITFRSTVTVGAAGTIVSTPVYIRLAAADAPNTYPGNIVLSSSGAVNVNVPVSPGTVASGDASLVSINPQYRPMSPEFRPLHYNYNLTVDNNVKTLWVAPVSTDPNAMITVNSVSVSSGAQSMPVTLNEGTATNITIVVTAQDNVTQQTYTIRVVRAASSNADLSYMGPSKGRLTPFFAPGITSYSETVNNLVSTFTVSPVSADPNAMIRVNGVVVPSGTASQEITLAAGHTRTINVVVVAQDHITKKTYTLAITRPLSSNATLSSIGPEYSPLSPLFAPGTTSYTLNVANSRTTMTVKPVVTESHATIKVNGTPQGSNTVSAPIALAAGATTNINVEVTAQDGTVNTYTIAVTRAASGNASLASIGPQYGPLSPIFTPGINSYTINVANSKATFTVSPVTADPTATMTVNGTPIASGSTSDPVALTAGATTNINVVVTAQDGTTTKTYTIAVNRAPGSSDSYQDISVSKPSETVTIAEDGIKVHQGISPNGDGIDDVLQIDNISQYPDNHLKIMNRNGQLIFETKGYDNSSKTFDGHSNKNGKMQLAGTYFFQLDYMVNGVEKHKTGYLVLKY